MKFKMGPIMPGSISCSIAAMILHASAGECKITSHPIPLKSSRSLRHLTVKVCARFSGIQISAAGFHNLINGSQIMYVGDYSRTWLVPLLHSQAPTPLRQHIIFKDFRLTELGDHDIENMFRGVYMRRPAHYQCSKSLDGYIKDFKRFSLTVSCYPLYENLFQI